MDPNFAITHLWLAWAYEQKGLYDEWVTAFTKYLASRSVPPEELAALQRAYTTSGVEGFHHAMIKLQKRLLEEEGFRTSYQLAASYASLGEGEEATNWLEKAYEQRSILLPRVNVNPTFDRLREHPRFQALLQRMNFPE